MMFRHWRRQNDNWGGGGGPIFIYRVLPNYLFRNRLFLPSVNTDNEHSPLPIIVQHIKRIKRIQHTGSKVLLDFLKVPTFLFH